MCDLNDQENNGERKPADGNSFMLKRKSRGSRIKPLR